MFRQGCRQSRQTGDNQRRPTVVIPAGEGMTGRTHPDWPICRFRVSDRSAKCGYKIRNGYADVICDEDTCPIEEDD